MATANINQRAELIIRAKKPRIKSKNLYRDIQRLTLKIPYDK